MTQPQEFFHSLVTDALTKRNVRPQPETEFYLVNLLNEFVSSERLYMRDSEGHFREEPLALLLKEALEQEDAYAKRLIFRQLGDVSLYTAGYFPDSITKRAVGLDYYIELGANAYKNVAVIAEGEPLQGVFEELGDRFPCFVEVLAEISDQTTPPAKTETDLLRVYDRWVATGSERAEKALREAGIFPMQHPKKKKDSL